MRKVAVIASFLAGTTLAHAQEQRGLGAHEHGVGQLNIAFEGNEIAMELTAPGVDVVGFEHSAVTDEDRARVDAAIKALKHPQDLFRLTDAAGCEPVMVEAELHGADHGDHDEDAPADHHEAHGDHHKERSGHHEEHGDHHGGHGDHHGPEEGEDGHDGTHTEFRAEYLYSCTAPDLIREIRFGFFTAFPNAREVEVQLISDKGSRGFEVMRDAPVLDLESNI